MRTCVGCWQAGVSVIKIPYACACSCVSIMRVPNVCVSAVLVL